MSKSYPIDLYAIVVIGVGNEWRREVYSLLCFRKTIQVVLFLRSEVQNRLDPSQKVLTLLRSFYNSGGHCG